MSKRAKRKRFVRRYLDPASRLGEVLFGLIMVLTVTLTAGLSVKDGRAGVSELLLSAIGCNIAWGIIDAMMYVMNCLVERSGKARLIRSVKAAPDEASAMAIVRNAVDSEFESMSEPAERETMVRAILKN